jgi:Rrf2 family protein
MALARRPLGEVVMLDVVAREESIPVSFVGKIFQSLARAGIIRSARGSGGGFCLTRPSSEVTILQVIEAIEGPIALLRCLEAEPECEHIGGCALCGLLSEAQDKVREVFAKTTLEQLSGRHLPPGLMRHSRERSQGTVYPLTPALSNPTAEPVLS